MQVCSLGNEINLLSYVFNYMHVCKLKENGFIHINFNKIKAISRKRYNFGNSEIQRTWNWTKLEV